MSAITAIESTWACQVYFDGFIITQQMDDVTLLTGMIVDQAALHGILIKIRDLGLPLLYVERKEGEMTR